jgi:hypothetical protein
MRPMPTHLGARILARSAVLAALIMAAMLTVGATTASAQPTLTDPGLRVSTAVTGVLQPTGIAFLGANDFFVSPATGGIGSCGTGPR